MLQGNYLKEAKPRLEICVKEVDAGCPPPPRRTELDDFTVTTG